MNGKLVLLAATAAILLLCIGSTWAHVIPHSTAVQVAEANALAGSNSFNANLVRRKRSPDGGGGNDGGNNDGNDGGNNGNDGNEGSSVVAACTPAWWQILLSYIGVKLPCIPTSSGESGNSNDGGNDGGGNNNNDGGGGGGGNRR